MLRFKSSLLGRARFHKFTGGIMQLLSNLTTPVLLGGQGYVIHYDYHYGVIKVLVDGTANKVFLAVRDDGTTKYGVYCDGTNVRVGWVEGGVLRRELATMAKPTGDFYIEIPVPGSYLAGNFDQHRGYLRAYVWATSGSKPGSYSLAGKLEAPTTAWAASTAKSLGNVVIPIVANGFYYKCTTAGTTAGTAPTWSTTEGDAVNDGTVVWSTYKVVPTVTTPAVRAYSLDGTTASIESAEVGNGLTVINPLRAQGNFIGRWFNTYSYSNVGNIMGEEIATNVHGSEILIQFSGTTTLKMANVNSTTHWISVSIDGGTLTRLATVNASTAVTGVTYPVTTTTLASGLTTGSHTARIVVAAMDSGTDKWTTFGGTVRFKGFSGDDGSFVVSPWVPSKKRILFIGDSITDGLNGMNGAIGGNSVNNHAGDRTYAKIAADQLNAIAETHGFGGTGILTAGSAGVPKAIDNIKEWYGTKKEEYVQPDIIVIAHHTNAGTGTDAEFIVGYKEVIEWFRAKWSGVPIFLLEASSFGTRRLTLPTIASSYASGVTFIGTTQESVTISAPLDTIHPNETGHSQIGTHFATRIKGILGDAFFGL